MNAFGHVAREENERKILTGFRQVVDGGVDAQTVGAVERGSEFGLLIVGEKDGGDGKIRRNASGVDSFESLGSLCLGVGRK